MPDRRPVPVTCLFLGIGGVLLSDGWNQHTRELAASRFEIDPDELEKRHAMVFDGYERDEMTLERYLDLVVMHEARNFTAARFKSYMFEQSQPLPGMIDLFTRLKASHGLKVVVVSNEARELNAHRIDTFALTMFVDVFVSSCFAGYRKPDARIFRLALDVAQVDVAQVLFVDNTAMHLDVAAALGIRGILHTDRLSTLAQLAKFGLSVDGATNEDG